MKRISIIVILCITLCQTLPAQEAARWLRRNAVSPDGSTIAFVYQGDIFTVGIKAENVSFAYDDDDKHRNVLENITFAPIHHGIMTKEEARAKAEALLKKLWMSSCMRVFLREDKE